MPPDSSSARSSKRVPPLPVVRRWWEGILERSLDRLSDKRLDNRNRTVLLVATALILTILILPSQQFIFTAYKPGEIATSDIRATQDFLIEDRRLTEIKRAEAEASAPYVYSLRGGAAEELIESFSRGLEIVREHAGVEELDIRARSALLEAFGVEPTPEEWRTLVRYRDDPALIIEVSRIARKIYSLWIVADERLFRDDRMHGIVVVDDRSGEIISSGQLDVPVISIDDARLRREPLNLPGRGRGRDLDLLSRMISRMLKPNLALNRELSDERRKAAASAVRPVLYQIKRGEMIVRLGERITPEQAMRLEKIAESRRVFNKLVAGMGIFFLVGAILYFPYRFARKNIRKFQPSNKDILLLSLVAISSFIVLKVGLIICTAVGGFIPGLVSADYYYLLPFAFAPMIVRIIINSEVALVFCAITAPLLGLMFDNSFTVAIYALLGGVVGAHGVRQCKDRSTIYTAGMKVSVVNLVMALSFQIQVERFWSPETLYCALFALLGGLLNAAFVSGLVPLIESLFNYTTDVKLLELANLNSPILREMLVRAPGTYHHSVLVGTLAEAAAESINANPLLARVAAYYHDIGKIGKPQYFVENQHGGENRHDRLTPNMSALVLISHVKEGVELAREHRLGQPIQEIIRQSHGTALIKYFYSKAKELAPLDQPPDENEFRYPGPKPQTREAGLVMLADAVEAASRTLTEPTGPRIQGMVQKIINNIFIDGQLDECELTLKNLHEIAKSFISVLTGIYHHRIDYPEPAYKERDRGHARKQHEDNGQQPSAPPSGQLQDAQGGGTEDLRRLGISRSRDISLDSR